MGRLLAALVLVVSAVVLGLLLLVSGADDDVEAVTPRPGALAVEHASPAGDGMGAASESATAHAAQRSKVEAEAAPAEGEPLLATRSPAGRIEGRVFHRGRLEPVREGVVHFELVHASGVPDVARELEQLDERGLDRRITAVAMAALDREGFFGLELAPDLWVARARVEPSDPTRLSGLGGLGGDTETPTAGFVSTAHELRCFVRELEPPLSFEVDAGVSISGRVVDAQDGEGVAAAQVVIEPSWEQRYSARTNASGRFELVGVAEESLRRIRARELDLFVTHPDYISARVPVALPEAPASIPDVKIALLSGVTIEGRVLDAEGRGLPLAELEASAFGERTTVGGRELLVHERARSDARGGFRFPALPPTSALTVATVVAGGERLIIDATSSRSDLVLRVAPLCRYEVHARSPDGAALSTAGLTLLLHGDDAPPRAVRSPFAVARERSYELELFAMPPEAVEAGEIWWGHARVLPTPGLEEPWAIEVELERRPPADPPRPVGQDRGVVLSDALHLNLDLRLLDAETGAPIAPGTFAQWKTAGFTTGVSIGSQGTMRVLLRLGTRVLEIDCEGYEPLRFQAESIAPGFEELELRLEPRAK